MYGYKRLCSVPHWNNTCFFNVCINVLSYMEPIVEYCKDILSKVPGDPYSNSQSQGPIIDLCRMITRPGDCPWFNENIYKQLFNELGINFGEQSFPEYVFTKILDTLNIQNSYLFSVYSGRERENEKMNLCKFVSAHDHPLYILTDNATDQIDGYTEIAAIYSTYGHFISYFPLEGKALDDVKTRMYPNGFVPSDKFPETKEVRLLINDSMME